MSVMEQLMEKTQLSRRNFLQMAGALSATATLYGCSGSGNGGSGSQAAVIATPDNLVFDTSMKAVIGSHPYNCGGRCLFKLQVKNGRLLKVTGANSDIPRATSAAADEAIDLPQVRPCIRGYGQIKRTYQPDRLKYPMKQTKTRGDLSGFVRISWTEALDTIAAQYTTTIARKAVLGYIPGMNGVFNYFGVSVSSSGGTSWDNLNQMRQGAIGQSTNGNSLPDLLNSKFILNIGASTAVSLTHNNHVNWYFTKAREKGIPIVTMDPLCTDTATTQSTGYAAYNIPAYISPRTATDAAILAAMANVIYRKNLHDVAFLQTYCFGFFPGDTVVSQSTYKDPITGVATLGQTFTTPTGMSFVEYLDSLQAQNGGYNGVLAWASQISGVSATIIENLGIAYGTTKPATIYGGHGACRTNGAYHQAWMLLALAAMTGNANKVGGGTGFISTGSDSPVPVTLGATKDPVTTATTTGSINTSAWGASKTLLLGTDNRTYAQLRADTLALNKVDLGAFKAVRDDVNGNDGRLRVEMIAITGNEVNQRKGCISKWLLALKKVRFIYGMDNFMTPSMAQCDIILPQDTHHERDEFQSKPMVYYFNNKSIEPMYECKYAADINAEILNRLGIKYGIYGAQGSKTPRQLMAEQWAGATVNATLLAINPTAKLPDFETFSAQGVVQFPIPAASAPLGLTGIAAGKFPTDTGRINFFSPFYFNRDKALGAAYLKADGGYYRSTFPPKAMFAPPAEGFDPVTGAWLGFAVGNKIKNGQKVTYTLRHNHGHHRRRAHSVYDNVAIIKENFPGVVTMNTVDAAARGINDGDVVYVYNDWGCNKVKSIVSKRVPVGLVHIADGEWYRASLSEKYEAWYDMDGSGVFVRTMVPVDVGGAPNNLQPDREVGCREPYVTYDNAYHGTFLEVSKTHPDL